MRFEREKEKAIQGAGDLVSSIVITTTTDVTAAVDTSASTVAPELIE